ncbi:gliding motility-associated C-terminal domain-containing protein [uncultured Maribacter sp.]|uniref:gliding motility-associated C-terminal domain-containing protein n=1 Tax=uncultured Maribacter sp. TaxID=431308 RepID=UPI0030EE386C
MNHSYRLILLVLLLGSDLTAYGQISNEGTISLAENTSIVFAKDFTNTADGMFSNNGVVHLKQDLINHGGYTFDDPLSSQSITNFSGAVPQNISGAQMIEIPHLQLNNTAGYQLLADLMVTERIDFTSGILHNRDFGGEFNVEPNVDYTGASDQSFVDGTVLKTGDDAFDFPVGANGYIRRIGVEGITDANTTLSAQYVAQNSNTDYAHNQKESTIVFIDNTAYWDVRTIQGSAPVVLKLSWNTNTAPTQITSSPEDIHIVHWNTGQARWIDLGGQVSLNNQTVTTAAPVAFEGVFALASVAIDEDLADTDNDGLPDVLDPDDNNPDIDGDGIPDGADVDVDGDGTDDNGTDTDGDGINDTNDVDVDGDGIPDNGTDSDGDGINDENDTRDDTLDTDGDGVPDIDDAFPNDPNESIDADGDGVGANADVDDDNANIGEERPITAADALTPDGDGINDTWVIQGIENYPNAIVTVHNRYGHQVFKATGYQNDWGGRYRSKSEILPAGSYYYVIDLRNGSTPMDGWIFINY